MTTNLEIETLNDATQYATIYCGNRAVAMLRRRRHNETGAYWRLHSTGSDNDWVGFIWRTPGMHHDNCSGGYYEWIAKRATTIVERKMRAAAAAAAAAAS